MKASKRSVKTASKRLTKEITILERLKLKWLSGFSLANSKTVKGGWRKREEKRLNKKLEKFGFEQIATN